MATEAAPECTRMVHPGSRLPAALLAAAAGFHLAALPGHLDWLPYAAFFAATAALQLLGAGVLIARPTARAASVVVSGNLVVLAVWLLARTIGVPVGPEAWVRHGVGLLDGLAAAAEVAIVMGLVRHRRPAPPPRVPAGRLAGTLAALVAVCGIATGAGLAAAAPVHESGADIPNDHSQPTAHSGGAARHSHSPPAAP